MKKLENAKEERYFFNDINLIPEVTVGNYRLQIDDLKWNKIKCANRTDLYLLINIFSFQRKSYERQLMIVQSFLMNTLLNTTIKSHCNY